MVHFMRSTLVSPNEEAIKLEQVRVAELMNQNIIENLHMSSKMDHLWMIMKADDQERIVDIIKTLPMSKEFYFDIEPLLN